MTFYSAQDFEPYYVTNVTRFEQIRDEALVEVFQTRVPICDVPSEFIDSTAAKMELCLRFLYYLTFIFYVNNWHEI